MKDCEAFIKIKDFKVHSNECLEVIVKCDKCQAQFKRENQKVHETLCLELEIECSDEDWIDKFLRKDKNSHLETCKFT